MIKLISITLRNFLSIGNVAQAVDLDQQDIVLVLGENLDLGGNDNRNGCGKTTILNGLSYGLFGEPLTKIKLPNLINKINGKNMLVSVIFEKNGTKYKVERGRKPDYFYFGSEDGVASESDAQGESRITQQGINALLGFNQLMFKHIIALNTYTTPFLSSPAADQREIIENLLGISTLSEKAELLRVKIKSTKTLITEEEFNIKSLNDINESLNKNKKRLLESAATWDSNKEAKLLSQAELLSTLMSIDIEQELKNHDIIKEINEIELYVKDINNSISKIDSNIRNNKKLLELTISKIENIHKNVCFNCKQEYHGDHSLLSTLENDVVRISEDISRDTEIINELNMELNNNTIHPKPNTYYSKWSDALEHKHSMSHVQNKILDIDSEINPYSSQLNDIDGDLKTIDYTTLNNLNSLLDHQEFLLKLLTNKDSFIRQKIINQNINFLNSRLEFYLNKLGLQHVVKFLSDLDVEISYLGKDLDFDNLSRGERTRLILSLSLSFRDAYEALNDKINLLFVDELIDTGLDPSGVESSLSTLKGLVRDTNRSIFLISHRDELLGRIDTILKVIKENGFTSFEQ